MTPFAERGRSRTGACRRKTPRVGRILPFRRVPFLAVAALPALFWIAPASAQVTLAQAEDRYQTAASECEANVQQRDRAFALHEQALDRVDAARSARNAQRLQEAQAESRQRALELMDLERTASGCAAQVESARATYQTALEAREDEILAELDAGPTLPSQTEQALVAEWQQLRTRVLELEAEAGSEEPPELRPATELAVDPRDNREDLVFKENLLEERAASYDSLVVDLQNEVAELERQMRRNQSLQDLLRDVQRSGPNLVPGAPLLPPNSPDDAGAGSGGDGGGGNGEELAVNSRPIEERIDLLRQTIELAQRYRDQARSRASVFRSLAEALGR